MVALAYSADGSRLATSGYDKQICVWDAKTGERRNAWTAPDPPQALAFAGADALLSSDWGKTLLWNRATGEALRRIDHGGTMFAQPSGTTPLLVRNDSSRIVVYDTREGRPMLNLAREGGPSYITSSSATPDGRLLAWGRSNGAVLLMPLPPLLEPVKLRDAALVRLRAAGFHVESSDWSGYQIRGQRLTAYAARLLRDADVLGEISGLDLSSVDKAAAPCLSLLANVKSLRLEATRSLNLQGTAVGDTGLAALAGCKYLTELRL